MNIFWSLFFLFVYSAIDEEQALVAAQINYVLTMIKLKAEMGTLLRVGSE